MTRVLKRSISVSVYNNGNTIINLGLIDNKIEHTILHKNIKQINNNIVTPISTADQLCGFCKQYCFLAVNLRRNPWKAKSTKCISNSCQGVL